MSRYKNGNPKRQSRFICLSCMKENMLASGIQRKLQREKGHIKDLYCLNCQQICKCCEVRYCDSFNDVYNYASEIRGTYYPDIENNTVKVV